MDIVSVGTRRDLSVAERSSGTGAFRRSWLGRLTGCLSWKCLVSRWTRLVSEEHSWESLSWLVQKEEVSWSGRGCVGTGGEKVAVSAETGKPGKTGFEKPMARNEKSAGLRLVGLLDGGAG